MPDGNTDAGPASAAAALAGPNAPIADSSMVNDWPNRDGPSFSPLEASSDPDRSGRAPGAGNTRFRWVAAALFLLALAAVTVLILYMPDRRLTPVDDDGDEPLAVTTTLPALTLPTTTLAVEVDRVPTINGNPVLVPGEFEVNASVLRFDTETRSRVLVLRNASSTSVSWSAVASGAAVVSTSPAAGVLPPGGSVFVTVERELIVVPGSTGVLEIQRSDRLVPERIDVLVN